MSTPPPPDDDSPLSEPLFDKDPQTPREPKNVRRQTAPPFTFILGSLALLIAIILFLGFNRTPKPESPPTVTPSLSPQPTQNPPSASGAIKVLPRTLPQLAPRFRVGPPLAEGLALPIYTETGSMDRIAKSIQLHQRLPEKSLVRTEEILNFFALRPTGPTGISRGVTLSTEAIACPWKPSSILFLVSFRGATDQPHLVSATFRPNRANVARYRLLGFETDPSAQSGENQTSPISLPARSIATVAIEIDPSISASELGTIEWSVDQQPVAPVPVSYRSSQDPSDDARFATLVCAFSQWLADERPELIDEQVLAALAREMLSKELTPERSALLSLIDRSLNFR
ncbi:MAG: von Willebrand factor type A domain-containing protein [Luteolibacter sp.]